MGVGSSVSSTGSLDISGLHGDHSSVMMGNKSMMGVSDGVDGMNSSSGSSMGSLGGVHGGSVSGNHGAVGMGDQGRGGVGHQVLGGGSGEGHTGSENLHSSKHTPPHS